MTTKSELILLHKKSYREFSDYIANNSQKQFNGQIALIVDDKSIKAWGAGVLEQKVIRYMNS